MANEAEEILRKLYERMTYKFKDRSGTHCSCCCLTRIAKDDLRIKHRITCELALAAELLGIPFEYAVPTSRMVRAAPCGGSVPEMPAPTEREESK